MKPFMSESVNFTKKVVEDLHPCRVLCVGYGSLFREFLLQQGQSQCPTQPSYRDIVV